MNTTQIKTCLWISLTCCVYSATANTDIVTPHINYDPLSAQTTRQQIEQDVIAKQQSDDRKSLSAVDSLNKPTQSHNLQGNLGAILYQAIQQKKWNMARSALIRYQASPKADPLLVHYAQGVLARVNKDYDMSEQYLQKVVNNSPDTFILPRLELARVQFENQKNKESLKTFKTISKHLNKNDKRQQGVISTVSLFEQALVRRDQWQGSLALGIGYDTNSNQSSGTYTCLIQIAGFCIYERKTPNPIEAPRLQFEGFATRRMSLSNNHGAFVQGMIFGHSYKHYYEFNQLQGVLSAGYSYKDHNTEWTLAPTFTFSNQGNKQLFTAWGLQSTWVQSLGNNNIARFDIGVQDQQYKKREHLDGQLYNASLGYWHTLNSSTTPFIRLGVSAKKTDNSVHSYDEKSLQLGVTHKLDHFTITAQAGIRERTHKAYSALMGDTQHDITKDYNLKISAPQWKILGAEPSLSVKYSDTKSSIDWLYSHDRMQYELRLEKRF